MKSYVNLTGLVVALFGVGVAWGQGPGPFPAKPAPLPPVIANNANNRSGPANDPGGGFGEDSNGHVNGGGPPVYGPGISEWIAYPRGCNCCGPVGGHGPILCEVYARTGITWLMGGGVVGDNARAGYTLGGGLRTLLFCDPETAWVVDVGLRSQWNDILDAPRSPLNGIRTSATGPIQNNVLVTASSVNYTYVNLNVGREHWLWGGPSCGWDTKLRVGYDVGGLYGTSKMVLREIRHRTDVIGGFQFAVHADLEVPTGCCIFFAGVRAEYGMLFSDILQSQNNTDVHMIAVLANFGLRF